MTDARAQAIDIIDECLADWIGGGRAAAALTLVRALEASGLTVSLAPPTHEASIAANTVLTAPMAPGKDSVLETYADADEMEYLGNAASALESPYRRPKDKRVQKLLRDAEAERAAQTPVAATRIFTDPRLQPGYKPPKK